ncbi:MAG: benzodiazapine receptor [Methanobacteriota archaeon]|jgi:benzodiazapine receptor
MEATDGFSAADTVRMLGFVVGVNAVGASPAFLFGADTGWLDDSAWYFPPDIAFPVAWTLLFTLMGVSLFLVYSAGVSRRDVRVGLVAFGVQMALNVAWTPVFFGLRRPGAGLVVVVLLWLSVLTTAALFDRVDRRASVLLLPYLAWLSFAVYLNYAVYVGL